MVFSKGVSGTMVPLDDISVLVPVHVRIESSDTWSVVCATMEVEVEVGVHTMDHVAFT